MTVDYREVSKFLCVSANQIHYQDILSQQFSDQLYYAKVNYLWGYHQLKFDQASSRVTAIITPWGCIGSYLVLLEFRRHRANIRSEWPTLSWKGSI